MAAKSTSALKSAVPGHDSTEAGWCRRTARSVDRELQSSRGHYGSQPGAQPVRALILTGTLSDITGIAARVNGCGQS